MTTSDELTATFERVSNWGRWGAADESGTLAFITPETRRAGAAAVRQGRSISLAHDLTTAPTSEQPVPASHHMLASGDALDSSGLPGYEATRDYLGTEVHGLFTTHLDALCHMFVNGRMYNGRLPADVTSTGAAANSVMAAKNGIVSRGVLLDIPGLRGVSHLAPEDVVSAAELEAAEQRQGITVGSGDILAVSTGRDARRTAGRIDPFFGGLAGLDGGCLDWLHDREIAVLAGDGISDPMPARPDSRWPFPLHQVGIVSMGLHLVDNLRLDELITACRESDQWTFLLTICPLRIPRGTGCPVNPVAVL
jgi:kynurenine formamidase